MTGSGCKQIVPLLDDLIDGTLDDARARATRAHLRGCADCATLFEQTQLLAHAASELGAVDAPSGQWARIAARLDEEEATRPRVWWMWHAWRRRIFAGMGALALSATAAVVIFLRAREPLAGRLMALPRPAASPDEMYEAALKEVARAEDDYTNAIQDLREIVATERVRWNPEVARAFDENLAAIDAAIARQADAARRSPGDPQLADALHASYRRQIDFMQEAVVRGEVQ